MGRLGCKELPDETVVAILFEKGWLATLDPSGRKERVGRKRRVGIGASCNLFATQQDACHLARF